jgi:hypothetical protein
MIVIDGYELTAKQASIVYADKADVLNVALFA